MKVFLNWIRSLFADSQDETFKNIHVAKVISWEKHPNADRLRVVSLDLGDRTVEPIVCGASNFDNGDLVVLALPGAVIPNNIHSETGEGFTLERAKIRGVESQGMICAAFELGLSKEKGDGIIVLKPGLRPGAEFSPEMIK
jgi:phenylalanyl-tRNA synthetase beta chain